MITDSLENHFRDFNYYENFRKKIFRPEIIAYLCLIFGKEYLKSLNSQKLEWLCLQITAQVLEPYNALNPMELVTFIPEHIEFAMEETSFDVARYVIAAPAVCSQDINKDEVCEKLLSQSKRLFNGFRKQNNDLVMNDRYIRTALYLFKSHNGWVRLNAYTCPTF